MSRPFITKGQLFQRKFSNDTSAIAGLVFFDKFVPQEALPYVAVFRDDMCYFELVGDKKPEGYDADSIENLLRTPIWNKTTMPLTGIARFIPAFPEQNGFIVYGFSVNHFFDTANEDSWITISNNHHQENATPAMKTAGTNTSDVLRHPIWHDLHGDTYALNTGTTEFNKTIIEINKLRAKVHRKELSDEEYKEIMRSNERYAAAGDFSINTEYFRLLARLEDAGLMSDIEPTIKAEWERREKAIKKILQEIDKEDAKKAKSKHQSIFKARSGMY